MSLREELEKAVKLFDDYGGNIQHMGALSVTGYNILRDHGQALVEALEDAERYREALQNIADLAEAGCALESIADDALHPTARSKTVDGGGV